MSYIDCEKCIHYQICCGYTSKEAIAESNRAMNNGESLLCFMYTPTADMVEIVHAAWVWGEICSSKGYCCTNCGAGFTGENAEWIAKEHKYCPNCGAKMDGERRE
jgi:hypothetical protein